MKKLATLALLGAFAIPVTFAASPQGQEQTQKKEKKHKKSKKKKDADTEKKG